MNTQFKKSHKFFQKPQKHNIQYYKVDNVLYRVNYSTRKAIKLNFIGQREDLTLFQIPQVLLSKDTSKDFKVSKIFFDKTQNRMLVKQILEKGIIFNINDATVNLTIDENISIKETYTFEDQKIVFHNGILWYYIYTIDENPQIKIFRKNQENKLVTKWVNKKFVFPTKAI